MVPRARKKPGKLIAVALLAVVATLGLGWFFAVPGELKTVIGFSRWHDSHVRASGSVERQPAGTRIYWEEFGKANGPPVVVLPAGLCTITVMGGQIETLAAESYRVIAIDSRGNGKSSNTAPALTDVVPEFRDGCKVEYGRFSRSPWGQGEAMKKSRYTEEQVAYALRLAESGTPVADVCRRTGIAEATFYLWKKKFGSLGVPEVRSMITLNTNLDSKRVRTSSANKLRVHARTRGRATVTRSPMFVGGVFSRIVPRCRTMIRVPGPLV